jgi:hypothetical protein
VAVNRTLEVQNQPENGCADPKIGLQVKNWAQKCAHKFHSEAETQSCAQKRAGVHVHDMKKALHVHKIGLVFPKSALGPKNWAQKVRTKFHYEAQNACKCAKTCWCART